MMEMNKYEFCKVEGENVIYEEVVVIDNVCL